MNSRREALKLLGLAPLAAKSSASQLVELAQSPGFKIAQTIGGGIPLPPSHDASRLAASPLAKALGLDLAKHADKLLDSYYEEREKCYFFRRDGLEPDIHALKSVSAVHKYRMQSDRDLEIHQAINQVRAYLWDR